MSKLHRAIAVALALVVTTPGCAAILNGKNKTIFLHMSEADAAGTTFYLDGKPTTWTMKTYSSRVTGRSGDVVFTEVTSLPALTVNSPARYVTVTAEFADGTRSELLLKKDLMRGYKLYLYLDMLLTYGIGTLIDVHGQGLYGINEVTVRGPGAPVAMITTRAGGQP